MQARPISDKLLKKYQKHIEDNPSLRTGINAVTKNGVNNAAYDNRVPANMSFNFSTEIQTGKITSQKSSGRCWLFAGLNTLRQHMAEKHNLENFELSQNYPMFWDKLEKANYFLESILDTLEKSTDSRLVQWLLRAPMQDGGQWDMFASLVAKYGAVPKYVMPETYHSSNSRFMNELLTTKLREQAARLREGHRSGKSFHILQDKKEEMIQDIYRMLCHFLGAPPTHFDFQIRDKDNNYIEKNDLTPLEFYREYIGLNIHDFVSVIHAPTEDKPFRKMYSIQYLGNVVGAGVRYLNLDINSLKDLALKQLDGGMPVWFGCDMGPFVDRPGGIMDTKVFDYESALSTSFHMTKAERLDYGESLLTHAMVFTGVHRKAGKVQRWKVENSWGEDVGNKGFFVMSDSWFDEFNYQVVIHKQYLDDDLLNILKQEPIELAPWDPMGSLAL